MKNKTPIANSAFNKWPLARIKLILNICDLNKDILFKHDLIATLSFSIFIWLFGKLSFVFEDSADGDVATSECT